MKTINKLLQLYKCKLYCLLRHHVYAYKPCSIYISSKAKVSIGRLHFNMHHDARRIMGNVIAGSLYVSDNSNFTVDDFRFYVGTQVTVNNGATLEIGSGYMMNNSVIDCFNKIVIGNDVAISKNVLIRDSNNHDILHKGYVKSAPIRIGNHVWIGMGAIIMPNVTIGDGAIIGAGALVNRDVPGKAIVAGGPAKVIRTNVDWK